MPTWIETLNRSLFLWMNASPESPAGLIAVARIGANDLIFVAPVILLGLWFTGSYAGKAQALRAVLTALIALVLGSLCGTFYFHPRPFMVPLGHSWITHAPDYSFPSDHATLLFSLALSLLFSGAKKVGGCMLALALIVAWSRVYVGVHFPLDMVGALFVAGVAYLLVVPLWRAVGEPLTQRCEILYTRYLGWLPIKGLSKS